MRLRSVLLAAASIAFAATPVLAAGKPANKAPVHHTAPAHKKASVKRRVAAAPSGISVVMDQVRVISFTHPVSTLFVGNPVIADATVIDPYHAFILGKTYGVTNMVALNAQSQQISNQQITVANRSGGSVTLNKGAQQFSYACTNARCETNPLPGDNKAYFDDATSSINAHQEQGVKAASVGANH
jgi:hypothetical protein